MPSKVTRTCLVLAVGTAGSLWSGSIRAADSAQTAAFSGLSKPKFSARWRGELTGETGSGWWTALLDNPETDGLSDRLAALLLPASTATSETVVPWLPTGAAVPASPTGGDIPLSASPLPAGYAPSLAAYAPAVTTSLPFMGATGSRAAALIAPPVSTSVAPVASPVQAGTPQAGTSVLPRDGWSPRAFRLAPPTARKALPEATTPTSGTLSTTTSVTYSTAPWVITAGDGTYPDLGGVATFADPVGTMPGTLPALPTITLDVAVTLSGLTFNTAYSQTLAAGTGGALSLTTTGTNTLDVPLSILSSPTSFLVGHVISAPIGGGGTYGLTKTGVGSVSLGGTNTYTGGTFINGGTLRISSGDAALGATGAGNDVSLNGGTLRVSSTALTTARNFSLGSGNGTFELFAAATINGVISGGGSLTTAASTGALTLGGANTYTGATTVASGGSITLSGAGSLLSTSGFDLTGTLALSNTATNNNNRLSDTAPITARGGAFTINGNATTGTPTSETTGAYTVAAGNAIIAVTPAAGGVTTLSPASINRQNNSTLLVRGTSLGAAAAASVAQINPATAPALAGGGGAAGSTTISIVPWMVGNTTATGVVSSNLVTYSAATGLRPLNTTTEYASSLPAAGTGSTTNVRLTATAAVPTGGTTVNALVSTSTAATILSSAAASDVLTIASGALLYSPASNVSTTISANLNFGSAEGIISTSISTTSTASTLTLSGTIAGLGGLTLNNFGTSIPTATTGNFYISGTSNTYTGTTTLLNATTLFTGTITNDGVTPSAFGQGTTPIVINAGTVGARLYSTGSTGGVINRDLTITGAANGTVAVGTFNTYSLTLNGNVALNRPLTLEGGGTTTSGVTINGNVSGAGYLSDSTAYFTYIVLGGNNSYSGGTAINLGTYVAGSDTALGTGPIYTNVFSSTSSGVTTYSSGALQGSGTGARTLSNPFVFGNSTSAAFTFAGTAPLTLTGAMNLNGNTAIGFTNTGGTTFSGPVRNGSLTKSGAQTLTLARGGGNSYSGGTVVSAGTLLVTNTSGSGTGSGAINVTGGTLGGTGFIVNTVPAGSTTATTNIASGATIQGGLGGNTGALTLTGNLTLASGSIIQLGLGSDGTNSSLARGGGVWTLPSGIQFTFTGNPTVGQFYDNLLSGLAADPGTENGWTVTNNGFTGTFVYDGAGGIDLTMTAVPEPATVLGGALTVGLFGLGLRRRLRGVAR